MEFNTNQEHLKSVKADYVEFKKPLSDLYKLAKSGFDEWTKHRKNITASHCERDYELFKARLDKFQNLRKLLDILESGKGDIGSEYTAHNISLYNVIDGLIADGSAQRNASAVLKNWKAKNNIYTLGEALYTEGYKLRHPISKSSLSGDPDEYKRNTLYDAIEAHRENQKTPVVLDGANTEPLFDAKQKNRS